MRFKITWPLDYEYAGHRGVNDPRPNEIEADKYEIFYTTGVNPYPMGLQFVKDGANVATFFTFPIAVTVMNDEIFVQV